MSAGNGPPLTAGGRLPVAAPGRQGSTSGPGSGHQRPVEDLGAGPGEQRPARQLGGDRGRQVGGGAAPLACQRARQAPLLQVPGRVRLEGSPRLA
jgi:hypothetical protein